MWLVSNGEAIEVNCPTSLAQSVDTNLTTSTSATGYRRANYFGGAHYLRTWDIEHAGLGREDAAKLEALTLGGFGADAVGFIPTGAEHLNLFTPAQSLLATVKDVQRRTRTVAGGVVYPSGLNTPGTTLLASRVPFPFAGQKVAISAVSRTGGGMSIRWLDATGNIITYQGAFSAATDTEYRRATGIYTAPANAVYFDAHIAGDIAAPSLTLGDAVRPWAVGQAAKSVVLNQIQSSLLKATNFSSITSSKGYQVVEVGAYE